VSDGALGISRAARHLGIAWGIIGAVALVLVVVLPAGGVLGPLLFAASTVASCVAIIHLILAKGRVLREREVVLWNGLARMISWNPTEGVVFLKNKQIDLIDDNPNDGGGIRIIYPLLGEELVLRVPLEIQTLAFGDSNILTKEYLPLSIKGTIYWKISGIDRYYLQISKNLHSVDDRGSHGTETFPQNPQFEVAEQWLRAMVEEKTRAVVSQVGTGLLIADQLSSDLSRAIPESTSFIGRAPESSDGYRGATDGLASAIKRDFAGIANGYGLDIHEVRLQEVRLPPEIYAAAVDACKSAYLPLKARAEAIERKLKLQAETDVIGRDAVGLREVAGSIPALAFQEFLAPLFLDFNRKRGLASTVAE
jgi:regulator of protease activity HflC (stomatin/prohibitin superfamily)